MQLVEFTKGCPPYNRGETAGFRPEIAARFIKRGVGKLTDTPVRRANTTPSTPMAKVVVRFAKSCPPYMVGETAGFSKARAAQLVKVGFAAYVKGDELKKLQASTQQPPPIKVQGKR